MIRPDLVAAVLLAAGESRRFGADNKLLALLDGRPLARHLAQRLAKLGFGALTAVCSDDIVAGLLASAGFGIVHNVSPERGLSHSLALGVQAVPQDMEAALICLADMPNVPEQHLLALLSGFDSEQASVVASELSGQPMPPALFGRNHFPALCAQTGDHGARALLRTALRVPASRAALADIDSPDSLSAPAGVARPNAPD